MKEMLKVFETNDGDKAVSARELHAQLNVGRDFTTWIKYKIKNIMNNFQRSAYNAVDRS